MFNRSCYELLLEDARTKLDAGGYTDVKVSLGRVPVGNDRPLAVLLDGRPDRVAEAHKLLPFSDNEP